VDYNKTTFAICQAAIKHHHEEHNPIDDTFPESALFTLNITAACEESNQTNSPENIGYGAEAWKTELIGTIIYTSPLEALEYYWEFFDVSRSWPSEFFQYLHSAWDYLKYGPVENG
jgi:hypothetical protein